MNLKLCFYAILVLAASGVIQTVSAGKNDQKQQAEKKAAIANTTHQRIVRVLLRRQDEFQFTEEQLIQREKGEAAVAKYNQMQKLAELEEHRPAPVTAIEPFGGEAPHKGPASRANPADQNVLPDPNPIVGQGAITGQTAITGQGAITSQTPVSGQGAITSTPAPTRGR
jgi:hypothetical protein